MVCWGFIFGKEAEIFFFDNDGCDDVLEEDAGLESSRWGLGPGCQGI